MSSITVQEQHGKSITQIVKRNFTAENFYVVERACNMIVYRHEQPYHVTTRVIKPDGNIVFTLTVN